MGKHQKFTIVCAFLVGAILSLALIALTYRGRATEDARISASYDPKTGRLALLKYDANGNGRPDTFSYMDGTRFIRIEIDANEDGRIDRWEYYNEAQKLERVDVSTSGDGRVNRKEFFEGGALVRAEEDSDGDGRPDKWEIYEGPRLATVAFDVVRRGTPDRRMVYGADGSARLEVDPAGTGHFVPVRSHHILP